MGIEQDEFYIAFGTAVVAAATGVLAVATGILAYHTYRLASETRIASKKQIGVNCWLEFSKRFDSADMIRGRSLFARAVESEKNHPERHGQRSELVLNFFEDLAIVYREESIDRTLAKNSFSYYACRWFEASKAYIDFERKRQGGNNTLFDQFQWLASELKEKHEFPTKENIEQFIQDEARLDYSVR